jgi:endonuclease YncB( thermonuclease family)
MIASLLCLVVAVTDGDTLKARCGEPGRYEQVTVRLAEIDAPEKKQAFGNLSKKALSGLCFQQQATIKPTTRDRYGRTVARVECGGKDASAEQVRLGMAWAFMRYLTDPDIAMLERVARLQHVGLWADSDPTPPWDWRHQRSTSGPRMPSSKSAALKSDGEA